MICVRAFGIYLLVFAAGCSDGGISIPTSYPTHGTLAYKGKPAIGARVTLHPQFDIGAVKFAPNGSTNMKGEFDISTGVQGNGAPPGEYVVTFELPTISSDNRGNGNELEVDLWKGKYADPTKSEFKVTIQKGDNSIGPFNLE